MILVSVRNGLLPGQRSRQRLTMSFDHVAEPGFYWTMVSVASGYGFARPPPAERAKSNQGHELCHQVTAEAALLAGQRGALAHFVERPLFEQLAVAEHVHHLVGPGVLRR